MILPLYHLAVIGSIFSDSALSQAVQINILVKRDTSPYAPRTVECPQQRPSIRSAASLSPNETSWLTSRRQNTIPALRSFLGRANITGFDVDAYFNTHASSQTSLPNIGIAVSGGGYRALMVGAGALSAFDNRTTNANAAGHLGGLLQSATYLTGLSGGSWLVGSLFGQDFASVQDIITGASSGLGSLWQFDDSIFSGPDTISALRYYDTVFSSVDDKEKAGFNVTITDYWGRVLSFQLFNASSGAPGQTFSSIAKSTQFANANTPMPIVVSDERAANQLLIASNATIFEFDPWEMGSYDPEVFAYAPLEYVGSDFRGGSVTPEGPCATGVDNIGFVVGTSSSLFNQFYLQLNSTGISGGLRDALNILLGRFGQSNDDISLWPNPFYGYNNGTNSNAQSKLLTLVDGGEDLQNIPFHPLLRSARNVDIIFAVDGSADTTTNWPNGTAMVATYERAKQFAGDSSNGFPAVPDYSSFVNLGLNRRPTFFGCDVNQNKQVPLVVYLPNTPYTYNSNSSTFQFTTEDQDRNSIILNAYNMATRANSTLDRQWPTCVGCAIMKRSWNRTGTAVPAVCNQCFTNYCWNGTTNSTTPSTYNPTLLVAGSTRRSGAMSQHVPWTVLGAAVSVLAFLQLML